MARQIVHPNGIAYSKSHIHLRETDIKIPDDYNIERFIINHYRYSKTVSHYLVIVNQTIQPAHLSALYELATVSPSYVKLNSHWFGNYIRENKSNIYRLRLHSTLDEIKIDGQFSDNYWALLASIDAGFYHGYYGQPPIDKPEPIILERASKLLNLANLENE
jgi:hypothetical protein